MFFISCGGTCLRGAMMRKRPLPSPNGRSRLRDCVWARTRPGIIKPQAALSSSFVFEHSITHADLREDIFGRGGVFLDLAADICHVDTQDLVVGLGLGPPDLLDEVVVGQDLPCIFAEQRHDLEFVERQVDVLPVDEHMVLVVVDREIPDGELA